MKAYYYENNGYNGILLTLGERFISYDERIDGIDINRENIAKIVHNFSEYVHFFINYVIFCPKHAII